MAASLHSAILLAALAVWPFDARLRAQAPEALEGLDLSADKVSYDGSTSRSVFQGLHLAQGDLQVDADSASSSSLDAESIEWQLVGNVRIAAGTATIRSDRAEFTTVDNVLSTLELRGMPTTFEDRSPERPDVASGGASRIRYDAQTRKLSLLDDAWLRLGANEITGCDLIYDTNAGTFESGSTECEQPFRIRIFRPREEAANEPANDSP